MDVHLYLIIGAFEVFLLDNQAHNTCGKNPCAFLEMEIIRFM